MNLPQRSALLKLGKVRLTAESAAHIRRSPNLTVVKVSFEYEQDGRSVTYTVDLRVDERFSTKMSEFDITVVRGTFTCLEGDNGSAQEIELHAEIMSLNENSAVIAFGTR